MTTFWLRDYGDALRARQQVRALAEVFVAEDPDAVEQVVGELATNCVEHRSGAQAARLHCVRRGGRLIVETLNQCTAPPDWRTGKNADSDPFPVGGHGLTLAAALATHFECAWVRRDGVGFVQVRAEFALRAPAAPACAGYGAGGSRRASLTGCL